MTSFLQDCPMKKSLLLLLIAPLFITGCATNPSARSGARPPGSIMHVRTTAYTSAEPGGSHSACGTRLCCKGRVLSAASDWSWLPVGTRFQILQTGEIREICDYGSALVGRETIDLYKANRKAMRAWGMRYVDIKILQWGSSRRSLEILSPRTRNPHVQRMVSALQKQSEGIPHKFHKLDS
jgi:3D (Asp-Asp-Asp) domain-containing protein